MSAEEIDKRFQSLVGKSKALVDREKAVKGAEEELKELRALKDRIKKRDYSVITENGGSLEDWSTRWLEEKGEKVDPVQKELRDTKAKLEEIEKWRAEQTKQAETEGERKEREAAETAVNNFRGEIADHIGKSDELKLLKVAGLEHEVFAVIQKHAQRTQQETGTPHVLEIPEAAAYVKKYYAPKLKETVKGLLALPDFKDVLDELTKAAAPAGGNSPAPVPSTPPQPEVPGHTARPATTLTPDLGEAPPRGNASKMSRAEKLAAAKATLRFTPD